MSKCQRKRFEEYDMWEERISKKHEHEFIIDAILETKYIGKLSNGPHYIITYDEICMCSGCHSFIVNKNGTHIDVSTNELDYCLDNCFNNKPIIKGIRKSSVLVGPDNIDELYFPDGFIYRKDK